MKKRKPPEAERGNIDRLVKLGQDWATNPGIEVLASVYRIMQGRSQDIADLVSGQSDWRQPVDADRVLAFFGQLREDASAVAPDLDWNIRLLEPDLTKTIARMLNSGPSSYRDQNIRAFLLALGLNEKFVEDDLSGCEVRSEVPHMKKSTGHPGRLDLLFEWEGQNGHRAVLIEAKVDAHLTSTQLADYAFKTRGKEPARKFVLGLDLKVMDKAHPNQRKAWLFRSWRDLLLQYERLRPAGARPSDLMFLKTLWHRVGGLTRKANGSTL